MQSIHKFRSVFNLSLIRILLLLVAGLPIPFAAQAEIENRKANKVTPVVVDLLLTKAEPVSEPPVIHPDAGMHLKKPLTSDLPFGHYLYLPQNYSVDLRESFPLILFLHGLGEKGNGTTELVKVLRNGPPKMVNNGHHFPAIIVSPQLTHGVGDWERINGGLGIDNSRSLNDLVNQIKQDYNVDQDRVYVTGLSLGGGGAWAYARKYADEIAAVVPVCGVNTGPAGIPDLANVGVWAFHSFGDRTVGRGATLRQINRIAGTTMNGPDGVASNYPGTDQDYVVSREAAQWVWRQGRYDATGTLRFTMFPDAMHNAWTRAYNDTGAPDTPFWHWLFNQKRN